MDIFWGGYQFGIDNVSFTLIPGNMTTLVWYCLFFFEILWLVTGYGGGHYQNKGQTQGKAFQCLD
jgi:hypothetical protein